MKVDAARERIAAIANGLLVAGDEGTVWIKTEGDGLHAGLTFRVGQSCPANAVLVAGEVIHHLVDRTGVIRGLLGSGLDVLAQIRVPLGSSVEDRQFKEVRHARRCIAIRLDRLVRPRAGKTKLPPGTDIVGCRTGWT